MKFKKSLLIICLVACVLLSVSAAAADDANETAIAIEDENQIIEQTPITDNEDIIGEKDNTTFEALQNKISDGENDLTEDVNSEDCLGSGEKITPDLKFYGLYTSYLTVNLPKGATGNVILCINSQNYSSNIGSDGVAEISMPELENGNYPYNITYSGDEKYSTVSQTGILKLGQNLTVIFEFPYAQLGEEGYSIYMGGIQKESNNFTVKLKTEDGVGVDSKKVTVKINGLTYSAKTDFEGKATFKVKSLGKDTYDATVLISGDNNFKENSTKVKVIVLSSLDFNINTVSETPVDNNESVIEITCRSGLLADYLEVLVDNDDRYWNEIKYKNEDDDVQVYLNLHDLGINKSGEYNISINHVKYTNSGEKQSEIKSYKLVVGKKNLDENEIKISSVNEGFINIKLPNGAGGIVTFTISGKDYKFDVVDGVATVDVPDLANGDYPYSITYSGDGKYMSFTKTGTLNINKATQQPTNPTAPAEKTTLILKSVKVKKTAKQLVLQATLKQGKKALTGKKVTFKFNGKKYTATTNAKGIAKVTVKKNVLKKLKVGKKVTYMASYGKTTVKKSVKVKR